MDLPPPPPPFNRPPEHHRDRYGSFIHHRDFPPFHHHHLPPAPPRPPHLLPPPSPPPPPPPPHHFRHDLHNFPYSPPRYSVHERGYEFDLIPKPYLDAFRPPRDSLPFQLHNDYPERSPRFRDEFYGYRGDCIGSSLRLDSRGRAREGVSMVSDVGAGEVFGRGLYDEWEDGEVRVDSWNNYRDREWEREMCDERDRVDSKFDYRGREWCKERFDGVRRWDYDVDDARGYDLWNTRNDERRSVRSYGINDRSRELYDDRDGYTRRQGYERDAMGLGRFSGRLGRRVRNEEDKRDNKKRSAQKIRAFDRIDSEKPSKRRKNGHQFQHAPKETNSSNQFQHAPKESDSTSTRGGKGKEMFERLEMRTENKKEREQSPLDLAISFESNGLVARAILAPSSPVGKSSMGLTPGNNTGEVNITSGCHLAKFSKEMSEPDVLICELDTQCDACGSSEEPLEKSNASVDVNIVSGSPLAKSSEDMNATVVNHVSDTRSDAQGTSKELLEKSNAPGGVNSISGYLLDKSSEELVVTDVLTLGLDFQGDAHGASEVLLEKSNASKNERLKASDAHDPGGNALVSETNSEDLKAEGQFDMVSRQTSMPGKKKEKANKKRACKIPEEHLEPSIVPDNDNGSTKVPCGLAVSARNNKSPEMLNSWRSDLKARRAANHKLKKMRRKAKKKILQGSSLVTMKDSDKKTKHNIDAPSSVPQHTTYDAENAGESLVVNKHSYDVDLCGLDSKLNLVKSSSIWSDLFTTLCSGRVNDLMHPPFHHTACSPIPEEPVIRSPSEANCSQLEKAENGTTPVLGYAGDYLKEMHADCGDAFDVVENAAAERVCSSAVVPDCLNVKLGPGTHSKFLPVEHKGITAESDTSILDAMMEHSREDGTNLSQKNSSVGGWLEATSGIETWICKDHSPKISRKRKASEDQSDIGSFYGEAGDILSMDCIAGIPCDRNSCEENGSSGERPSGYEDLSLDVSGVDVSGVDGFKKKKVDSSRSTSVSWDGASNDQPELGCGYPVLSEQKASLYEDANAVVSDSMMCGAINMEVEVREGGYSIPDVDGISTHQENLCVNDGAASLEMLSSDKNVGCISSSGNELIESDSDDPSCPSSPEDLLLFSDFSSPPLSGKATLSQSRNGIIYGTDRTFNRKPVSAERRNFSLRNSLQKSTAKFARTGTVTQPFASQVTHPVVQKSNVVPGKFTLSKNQTTFAIPKVYPTYPQNIINTAKALPTTQAPKSRTWSRTVSTSVPATTPSLQPFPLPQGRATKTPRNNHTSYVRTGNSLVRTSPSSLTSPGSNTLNSTASRLSPGIDDLKKGQVLKSGVEGNHVPRPERKSSPSRVISAGFHASSSSVYRRSPSTDGSKKSLGPKSRAEGINAPGLQRKSSPYTATSPGINSLVYRLDDAKKAQASKSLVSSIDATSLQRMQPGNTSTRPESPSLSLSLKSPTTTSCNPVDSLPVASTTGSGCFRNLGILHDSMKSCAIPECQNGSGNNSDSQNTLDDGNSGKKIMYVKRGSNQLVAASNFDGTSVPAKDKTRPSDSYYKSRENQLVRASLENHLTKRDASVDVNLRLGSQAPLLKSTSKRQLVKGFPKTFSSSKLSLVWKLHEDAQTPEKHKISERPQKLLSRLCPWKRATYRRMFALGSRPTNKTFTSTSQKLLLSRKRGAVYTKSSHGYSLRMSKVFSVGGSSLKWSKSMEKDSKNANEEATRAVAAFQKKKKQEKTAGSFVSKARNSVSSKLVSSVKLSPGERIFRIGSERYKMDPTWTLHRITAEENPSTSVNLPPEKGVKKSYVPRRLFIGNNEYVRIGNGNQLVRDPKKRIRVLASEKVRWSLRTARMRWAKKKKYCQFFTKFGKCNKDDGKCPYIHDPTKIVVCTKFLNNSCSNPDCKLTHKIIPERMQDCSYFLKGSCSNENCPYRHVNVDPDSPVCESFVKGYCADGNECRKKHTYACPAYEATGICPQATTCKLHHPKKKTEKKSTSEEKIVKGRYFDGGLLGLADYTADASEEVPEKGKDEEVFGEGKYPDYISLDVSDDEEMGHEVTV